MLKWSVGRLQNTTIIGYDARCMAIKHNTLTQSNFNVGPPSETLTQHKTKIGKTYLINVGDNKVSSSN